MRNYLFFTILLASFILLEKFKTQFFNNVKGFFYTYIISINSYNLQLLILIKKLVV